MPLASAAPPARATLIGFGAALFAILPLSTDVYLTAMPDLGRSLGASLAGVQATMAAFTLGFGIGHLALGALADHYGRRAVATGGIALYLLTAAAAALAPDLELLIAARFLQGAAGATGPILARAIVRDAVPPRDAGRTLSLMGAATGIAPTLAPVLGAGAAALGGWRLALALLVAYGSILLAAVVVKLPETLPEAQRAARPFGSSLRSLREVVRSGDFLKGTLAICLGYGALFTWLSTSPFLLIGDLGMAPATAAVLYAAGSGGFVAGSLVSAWLARRTASTTILLLGAALAVLGSAATFLLLALGPPGMIAMLAAMLPFYIGWGLAQPQAVALAMRPFPHIAGQASAWLGLFQQLSGVLIAGLAVWLGAGSFSILVMTGASALLLVDAIASRSSQ